MKNENEQTKVIEQYENLISFCNSLPAVSLANNLHKKKVDFLCDQYSLGDKAVSDANAYITMMKKILCMSCDNLCSNYAYNYELYYQSIEDTMKSFSPLRETAAIQIESLIRGLLTNVLNPTGLEYIWTRVNADRNQFYDAVQSMFLHFDLNKKLELIVNDLNTALESKAVTLTSALTWKKVALDENPEGNLTDLKQPNYSQMINDPFQIDGQDGSSGSMMDYGQKFMEEFLPTTKMRQKMTEYRKIKVIEKIQEDYAKDLAQRQEELLAMIDQGIEKVTQIIEQYRIASFYQVNGRKIEQIPAEILRLEEKTTELKREDKQSRLIPYRTKDGRFATIVSKYAIQFPNLIDRDVDLMTEVFATSFLHPFTENLESQITKDITIYKMQGNDSKQAKLRLQEFLDRSYGSFMEVNEITSQISSWDQIEFGALKDSIDSIFLFEIQQMKTRIQEELQQIVTDKERVQEEQLRIGIKAMNDIAYQKFYDHWSMSLKARVRTMIEQKDFTSVPSHINYEVYLSEMQSFLGMDAKELESIREVIEYQHTGMIRLPRYQFLKVSMERNNSDDELIRMVVKQEITSYLSLFPPVQKEMKEIYDHALRLYISEYGESMVKNKIQPALSKIQTNLLEEYHAYVTEEHLRENYNYMDFTKYIHVYGKIESQILEFILGNEKSFPMESIAYDHWADGTAVTTANFKDIARTIKEQWLKIKARAEY